MIHFFLWLTAHNKIHNWENLVKKQSVDELTCAFCSEPKTCSHLFFECVVAKVGRIELRFWSMWGVHFFGLCISNFSFESIDSMWLCEKKIQNS
jgi:hypothetical protein